MKFLPFLFLLIACACNSESIPPPKPVKVKPGNLEFFEVYSFIELAEVWNSACIQSAKTDTLPRYMDLTKEQFQSRRLENLVSFASDSTYYFVKEKDLPAVDSILAIPEIKNRFPKDLEFMWSYCLEANEDSLKGRYLYALKIPKGKIARIDGRYVNSANLELHGGRHNRSYINLTMTIDGTLEWEKMTEDNLNRCIAMTMDQKVLFCARVICPIQSGGAAIEGNFSLKELEELTARINRGRR